MEAIDSIDLVKLRRTSGNEIFVIVDAMLSTHVLYEQAYKSCMGLLQLIK